MEEREVIDLLLGQLLGPRLGHLPAAWPGRLYEVVERLARAASQDRTVFLKRLIASSNPAATDALIDAATIGHTSFFRHPEQFDQLRRELPRLAAAHRGAVRIWCAACSTGEEVYSVALTAERAGVMVDVLGTDVSPLAIRTARAGVYSDSRIGRLPDDAVREWAASASLRTMVRFEVASIVGPDPACGGGPFDLIFCRNLLIYFERETVPQILEGLAENLLPGGALVLSPADAVLPLPGVLRRGGMVGWLHPSTQVAGGAPASKGMPVHLPSMRVRAAAEGIPAPAIQETPIERAARLFGSGQGVEAEAILAKLLNREPDHIAGWFLLGEALLQRGERSQARVAFTRASRCSPKLSGGVDGEALQRAATRRAVALDG